MFSSSFDRAAARRHHPASQPAAWRSEADVSPLQRLADQSRVVAQLSSMQALANAGVIQRNGYYSYGSAKTTPHVHCYGTDSHLKIFTGSRVQRLNIVQNGKRHAQADEALEAATGTGNQALIDAVNDALDGY
ncbi:MAG: hypothetical protein ACK5IP_18180 [Paracoccus sp. (in: a-proteobacteria)]